MLADYKPQDVFRIFEEYCAVPHPSRHTEAATRFCLDFAKKNGIEAERDGAGNVILRKPAAKGCENAPTVILQGHLDMVAARDADAPVDPEKEGLCLFTEGDFIGAKGTTLGGDDGIAVAMVLALLADKTAIHPKLEAVFTTDEEIGMLGAAALDMTKLSGKYLLNLDSEDEGVLTVSCAGGVTVHIDRKTEKKAKTGTLVTLSLTDLTGGHSGAEIHRGRANALVLLAGMLHELQKTLPLSLVSFEGGEKDNAIAVWAKASFFTPDGEKAKTLLEKQAAAVSLSYEDTDPQMKIAASCADATLPAMTEEASRTFLSMAAAFPYGVQKMSRDIVGLVQTSLNFGIARTDESEIRAVYSVRSSVGKEKDALVAQLGEIAKEGGASLSLFGDYPAWEYKPVSVLRDTVLAAYREQTGKEMKVEAIHAGLECGLFSDRIPGIECVSLGPAMRDIHTSRERLSISSCARTYDLLRRILEKIAKQ